MFLKMKVIINSTIQDVESVGVNSKELEIYQKFEND